MIDILVTDTSPLITLAYGLHLEALRLPKIRIVVPDAVIEEATRKDYGFSGAAIYDFSIKNRDIFTIQMTTTGMQRRALLAMNASVKGLGEKSVMEVLDSYTAADPTRKVLLLYEDKDVTSKKFIIPKNVSPITTGDFLRTLESKGLIQSAEETLADAEIRGQNVERNRRSTSQQSSIQALEDHIDKMSR